MTRDERTLTLTLHGKATGQENLRLMGQELQNIRTTLSQLKKDSEGAGLLRGVAASARENARVIKAESDAAVAAARQQVAETRARKAASEALTSALRAQSAQATLTARLSAQADREAAQAGRVAMQARREEIDRVKLSMARLRAEFDDGLKDQGQYQAENQRLINTLKLMGERADFTTRELKQLEDMKARLAREGNSVAGVVNPAGLSGNVANSISATLPGLLAGLRGVVALSPSLGAAAANVSGVAQALQTVRVAAEGAAPSTLTMGRGFNTAADAAGFLRGGAAGAGSAVASAGSMATVAGAAFGGLALLVTGAGTAANKAVNEYAKLEFSLAKVSTLTEETPAQLGETRRELLNMSRDLGMTYQDLANGLYDVLGASVAGTEDMGAALDFTREAAQLAVAGATDTATATDVLTSVMNAYKTEAKDTKTVSDGLFRAVLDGKMGFNDLAMSLGMVTAISAQAGVPLQEVLAAMATMTANGIRASSAVDYLRSLIKAIVDPSQEARGIFDGLGIAYGDNALKAKGLTGVLREIIEKTGGSTQKMSELLGGVEAVTAATSIASGEFGRMETNLANQANAAGSTATAYGKMAGTIQKENDKLKANWTALWAGVGEVFAPIKASILEDLNNMLNRANELLEKFLRLRGLRAATTDVSELEQQLRNTQQARAIAQRTLDNPNASEASRIRAQQNLEAANANITRLRAEIATARAELTRVQAESTEADLTVTGTLTGAGALLPGQERGDTLNAAILAATGGTTGNRLADEVAGWCARWVRLTLGKAEPNARAEIEKWFGGDAGQIKTRLSNNNMLRKDLSNLQPGDVVVYDKDHIGIYVGNGKVRGNNQWGVQNGRDVVSTENMYSLGTVAGYVRLGEVPGVQVKTSKPPAAPGPDTDKDGPLTAAQIIKAQQLTAALDKAQAALKKNPGSIPLIKAVDAADQAMKRWGEQADGNARALTRVKGAQDGLNKSNGEYIATQKDLRLYGNDALRLIKDQAAAQESGNRDRIALAQQAIATWQGESKARAAVLQVERAAYQSRQQLRSEDEQREKARASALRTIAQGVQKGKEDSYKRALDTLKQTQAEELAQEGLTAVQREQIVKRTGPAILKATYALNAAIKKGKEDEAEAWRTSEEAKALTASEVNAEVRRRRDAARAEEKAANQKAQGEQRQARQQAARTRVQEEQQLAAELAGLKTKEARDTATRLKSQEDAEIARAEGNAQRQLQLTRKYSQAQYDRQVAILAAERKAAERKAAETAAKGKPNEAALVSAAGAAYLSGVETARQARLEAVQAAQKVLEKAGADAVATTRAVQDQLTGLTLKGAQDRVTAEQAALDSMSADRQEELRLAGTDAEKRLEITRRYALEESAIRQRLAGAQLLVEKRQAEAARDQAIAAIPKGTSDTDRQRLKREIGDAFSRDISAAYRTYGTRVQEAQRLAAGQVRDGQQAINDALTAGLEAGNQALADVLADPGAFADGARGRVAQNNQLSLQTLIAGLPTAQQEVRGFTQAVQDFARDGIITQETLETILLLIPDFGSGLGVLGEEFREVEERLDGQNKRLGDLMGQYERGEVTAEDYREGLRSLATSYDLQAEAARRAQDPALVFFFEEAAKAARGLASGIHTVSDELAEIARRGADARWLAENPGDVPDPTERMREDADGGFTFGDPSGYAQGFTDAFLGESAQERLRTAIAFTTTEAFQDAGQEAKEAFWGEFEADLGSLDDEALAALGSGALRGILAGMGNDEALKEARARVQAALTRATDTEATDAGYADLGAVISQFEALDARAEGYSATLSDRLLPELERIRDAATDPALKQAAEAAIGYLNGEVEAGRELVNVLGQVKLTQLDRLKASGGIGEQDYIDQRHVLLVEQENARYRLDIQGKTGKALELAEAQHQINLGNIVADGMQATQQLTWRIQDETRQVIRESEQADLEYRRSAGMISERAYIDARHQQQVQAARDEFNVRVRTLQAGEPAYVAAELALQVKLGQITRQGMTDQQALTDRLEAQARQRRQQEAVADLDHRRSLGLVGERAYLEERQRLAEAAAREEFAARVAKMEEGSDEYRDAEAQLQADLTAITRQGVLDRIALEQQQLQAFIGGLDQLGGALESAGADWGVFLKFAGQGIDLFGKFQTNLKSLRSAFNGGSLFDKLGAVGGTLGLVATGINLVGQLGDALLNLSPGFRAWKTNLLEVAEAQRKALSIDAGGFNSPWAKALEQDAANREKLANAGFWKRIWWGLTGSAPQVMKSEAAKLQAELQTIFAELGSGVSSAFTGAMNDAFLKGEMADWAANFDKTFDQQVGQLILKTMVTAALEQGAVATDLAALATAIKEQRYSDIPPILERIKAGGRAALSSVAAYAPSLPGYGSQPASGGSSGDPAGNRQRDELLYQYENETDPARKEALRKQLLGLSPGSGGPSGGSTVTITREPVPPQDFARLNTTIQAYSDRIALFEQAGQIQLEAARLQREAAGINAQAAGLILLAAERLSGSTSTPTRAVF